jgi:UDP-N-acetyl-D-mannosaminuronic acid dehydrogenase
MVDVTETGVDVGHAVVAVGCGSVGLPLAVALASRGLYVLGYDIDVRKVGDLNEARLNVLDEGLAQALGETLAKGTLRFTASLERVSASRTFILAVPTPASAEHGYDSGSIDAAMATVAGVAQDGDLVCVRATVPIGATRAYALNHRRLRFGACPDRTLSGLAFLGQFDTPHVVGGVTDEAGAAAEAIFVRLGAVVRVRDSETAEAIKLFANVQRDVAFAQANQFALICEAARIDYSEVSVAGSKGYPRFSAVSAGPVGGPCLTKDVHVLAASPALKGLNVDMLLAARLINGSLATYIAVEILAHLGVSMGPVAICGLAFKGRPPILDVRGSFSESLTAVLRHERPGIDIRGWEPAHGGSLEATLTGAAVVVLANDHPALTGVLAGPNRLAPGAAVFDLTGVLAGHGASGVLVRRFGDGGCRP